MSYLRACTFALLATSLPGAAHAMAPADILLNADKTMQVIMAALIVAALTAIVVMGMKLRTGERLNGGSAYLQALRLGGPLIGLLGAAYNMLMINIAIANIGDVSYPVLAPSVAESVFIFMLGLIAGVVAVVCNWVVEARIDRAVLRS
jgi:hypothetical protein